MTKDLAAARARAETRFKAPDTETDTEAARAERELRERTARLRAERLAQDALKRKGAEIRAGPAARKLTGPAMPEGREVAAPRAGWTCPPLRCRTGA